MFIFYTAVALPCLSLSKLCQRNWDDNKTKTTTEMQTLIAAILQLYNFSQQHRELLLLQYSNNALVVQRHLTVCHILVYAGWISSPSPLSYLCKSKVTINHPSPAQNRLLPIVRREGGGRLWPLQKSETKKSFLVTVLLNCSVTFLKFLKNTFSKADHTWSKTLYSKTRVSKK